MGKRGHSEEEILRALREAKSGDTVVKICRKYGIVAIGARRVRSGERRWSWTDGRNGSQLPLAARVDCLCQGDTAEG